ncbi:MAG: hypothetical protein KGI06_04825, partial [Candidatus Micrarchaeota archaeon]|nr:hypothetical protein [Candidatus Micrarchaeota archaeon]
LYNVTGSRQQGSNVLVYDSATPNSVSFTAYSLTNGNTFMFESVCTDSSQQHIVTVSNQMPVVVNAGVIQTSKSPTRVMTNLVTWTNSNGYSSIQWQDITELDVFHLMPNYDGSLSSDGTLSNLAAIISNAHSHDVKALVAIGGWGVSTDAINSTISNPTYRDNLVNNIVNEVQANGYDGVQIDFEGSFNRDAFTAFMQQLSAALWSRNPNYVINVEFANWDISSFNLPALAPYATHFDMMFNPSISELNYYAGQVGKSKLSAGYDLTDPSGAQNIAQNLVTDVQNGYGIFFWQAQFMNSTIYNDISAALASK